jgi:hypothetical protein
VGFFSARLVLFADGCGQDHRRGPYHHFGTPAKICYPPRGNAGYTTNATQSGACLTPTAISRTPTFGAHLAWDGQILPPQANRYSQQVRRYFVAELGPVAPVPSRPAALRNARTLSIIDGAEIFRYGSLPSTNSMSSTATLTFALSSMRDITNLPSANP